MNRVLAKPDAVQADNELQSIIGQLSDPSQGVRATAAMALGVMQKEAVGAVPALAKALGDEDPFVRKNAAWALGMIGENTSEVRRALLQALKDPGQEVRENAKKALERLKEVERNP